MGENGLKGEVFDTKKHSNIKHKAEYRRINKYYKGLAKTKAEKARRQQILDLQDKGFTIREIAGQLNVSERTVKRDLQRMKAYLTKLQTQLIEKDNQQFLQQITEGLTPKKQREAICRILRNYRKITKPCRCKSLQITINLNSIFKGNSGVKYQPNLPLEMSDGGRITLQIEACGRTQAIARIYVGKIIPGSLSLHTNQSMNEFVKPTLKGLKVVQSSEDGDA
jgi:DNA-binding CsgD family transcriptional regulator